MLCDFDFQMKKTITIPLNLTNTTNETQLQDSMINTYEIDVAKPPSILHFILMFWVFTLFCDELRQVKH